jgi:8-oxo-dGTP diphosphatase
VSRAVPACPHCATEPELPLVCDRCGWRWHANPLPAAAVLLERWIDDAPEPSVLLLRRAVEPGLGDWDLPAGYLDPGESFEQAARRETAATASRSSPARSSSRPGR